MSNLSELNRKLKNLRYQYEIEIIGRINMEKVSPEQVWPFKGKISMIQMTMEFLMEDVDAKVDAYIDAAVRGLSHIKDAYNYIGQHSDEVTEEMDIAHFRILNDMDQIFADKIKLLKKV